MGMKATVIMAIIVPTARIVKIKKIDRFKYDDEGDLKEADIGSPLQNGQGPALSEIFFPQDLQRTTAIIQPPFLFYTSSIVQFQGRPPPRKLFFFALQQ
jgi:hypothetical protein